MRFVCALKYLFVFLQVSSLNSQTKSDSLFKIIETAKNDSVKVNALNRLARNVSTFNPDSSILLSEKAIVVLTSADAEKINAYSSARDRKSALAYTYLEMGSFYYEKTDFKTALKYFQDALRLYEENNEAEGRASALRNMAVVYAEKGDFSKALEQGFKALRMEEKRGNKVGILDNLADIGMVYYGLGEFEKALDYSERALKLAQELNSKNRVSIQFGNLAIVYSKMQDFSKAREFFFKALQMEEEMGRKNGVNRNLINIGTCYMEEGNYSKALEFFFKALKISEEIGNINGLAGLNVNIGDTYTSLKKYKAAGEHLFKGLKLALEARDFDMVMSAEYYLTRMYSKAGDYKRAFEHYDRYISIRDSLFNKENTKKNIQAELNFEFEKKEALQKAGHEKKVIALEAESRIQRNTRNFVIVLGVMLLLLVTAGLVYFNNKKNLRLREEYSRQLLWSQEDERKRISKELHDSIGQNLLFIKNQLQKNNRDQQLMLSVDETLEEVRSISKDLYPNQLEKYGLVAAVDNLAEKVKETSDVFVSHDLEALNKNIPADELINYYRIIQECVSNALKHAGATALRITAVAVNGGVQLVVQDNGSGFDKTLLSDKAQRSFGMLNLEERTKFLKGKFEIETLPGKGTKCIFFFPA